MADNRKHISLETLRAFKEEGDIVVDEKIEDASNTVAHNFASEFVAGAIYSQGSYCIHEGVLYQKTYGGGSGLEESWNPSHWTHILVMDILGPIRNEINMKLTMLSYTNLDIGSVTLGSLPEYCIISYTAGNTNSKCIFMSEYKGSGTYEYTLKSDTMRYFLRGSGLGNSTLADLMNANNLEYLSIRQMQSVTWSQLKYLRDVSRLIPGVQYRITDYAFTTTTPNSSSAGHAFDVIVTADSTNVLNENARATKHEGDAYFADSNLAAWKLKYCIDNDVTRFKWADNYGIVISDVIYKRDSRYDDLSATYKYAWVNGNDKRYTDVESPTTETIARGSTVGGSSYRISSIHQESGKGVIYRLIDEYDNDAPYDFKNCLFRFAAANGKVPANTWAYTFNLNDNGTSSDVSIKGLSQNCRNNTIHKYETQDEWAYELPFNVFYSSSPSLSAGWLENFIDNMMSNCTFGRACTKNTLKHYGSYVTMGDFCNNNFFAGPTGSVSMGDSCSYNTFDQNAYQITMGANCSGNTFHSGEFYCAFNTLGNNCSGNYIGGGMYNYITLGNYCSSNRIGDNCTNIKFGTSSSTIDFVKNVVVDNECSYLYINCSDTSASTGNILRNVHIHSGISGTSSSYKTITVPDRHLTYTIDYYASGSQSIDI